MSYHPLLARQLRRAFGSSGDAPREMAALFSQIDAAYRQFDQDRRITDRAMELSSDELSEANALLLSQNRRNEKLLDRLRKTLSHLNTAVPDSSGDDLLHIAREIEHLVADRQATEIALRKAKDAADAANRAKSDFLANMSHEIRTPLNAVVGMAGLILDADLSASQREYVEIIRQNGDALLGIVNDILDFSKIEAGRLELESVPCNLHDIVGQVLDLFSGPALKAGLDLGVFLSPGVPPWVVTDPVRLRQILVNLVDNAIKFTSRGGVGIFVDCRQEETSCRLEFSIEDTGIGIPPERMDSLFKAFSQVDTSTTRKYGGTGLGLAITRRLCELLGGTVHVTSQPGRGSSFCFHILAETCSPVAWAPMANAAPLSGRRILVADDTAIHRRLLVQQLGAWGLLVDVVTSSGEALAAAGCLGDFDILVLDSDMPGMKGESLARELQQSCSGTLPPVLLLGSDDRIAVGGNREGIVKCLAKPVKPAELLSALCGLLRSPSDIPAPAEHVPGCADTGFAGSHPLRILIAEDNAVNRKVIGLSLSRLGYHCTETCNGREAVEAVTAGDFDVVLMDIQMPELDGLSATRLIRARSGCARHPYIIALTANVSTGHRADAAASGMQDFLAKPLRPQALAEALGLAYAWLEKNPAPSPGAPPL